MGKPWLGALLDWADFTDNQVFWVSLFEFEIFIILADMFYDDAPPFTRLLSWLLWLGPAKAYFRAVMHMRFYERLAAHTWLILSLPLKRRLQWGGGPTAVAWFNITMLNLVVGAIALYMSWQGSDYSVHSTQSSAASVT